MCLINFHFKEHPKYKVIIAANRDEAYDRPTSPAKFWNDYPNILAGRDLLQMGTWMGITRQGRFAALTNFRDPTKTNVGKMSRGEIIKGFLKGTNHPKHFLATLHTNKDNYDGFNLIVGNPDELYYYSNISSEIIHVSPGTHGVSNHMFNTPWPKVVKGKQRLRDYVVTHEEINIDDLFDFLSDQEQAMDEQLPNTGVGLELERKLSPLFIQTPNYGTRSSTVLLVGQNNLITFVERTYSKGEFVKDSSFTFQISDET